MAHSALNCIPSDIQKAEELLFNGFTMLEIEPLGFEDKVINVLKDFRDFTRESDEFKQKWTFDLGTIGKPDTGYIRRLDEESKHFLHAHLFLSELLFFRNAFPVKYYEMIHGCNEISQLVHHRLILFATALDFILPGMNIVDRLSSKESKLQSVLRLLQYDHVTEPKEIAEAHEDQSVLTAALYESHQGLFLGKDPKKHLHQCQRGKILVFPGKKLQCITGGEQYHEKTPSAHVPKVKGGVIEALTHGVVSLPDVYGTDYQRSSAVYFLHDANIQLLQKLKGAQLL